MRCYLHSKPNLFEIYGDMYYPEELDLGRGIRADVVLCKWVEGETLRRVVERALGESDKEALYRLSTQFNILAKRVLERRGWAHGDLNLENIICGADAKMRLIDFDASYVASLAGSSCCELGTPAFQSPRRTAECFDESIDDFSIALISVALRALSLKPELAERYPIVDALLLDGQRLGEAGYEPIKEVMDLLASEGEFATYRMALRLSQGGAVLEELPILFRELCEPKVEQHPSLEFFVERGVWGCIDPQNGEIIIPPLFDEVFEFHAGLAKVRVAQYWHIIDSRCRVIER